MPNLDFEIINEISQNETTFALVEGKLVYSYPFEPTNLLQTKVILRAKDINIWFSLSPQECKIYNDRIELSDKLDTTNFDKIMVKEGTEQPTETVGYTTIRALTIEQLKQDQTYVVNVLKNLYKVVEDRCLKNQEKTDDKNKINFPEIKKDECYIWDGAKWIGFNIVEISENLNKFWGEIEKVLNESKVELEKFAEEKKKEITAISDSEAEKNKIILTEHTNLEIKRIEATGIDGKLYKENTISDLVKSQKYIAGDVVEVLSYSENFEDSKHTRVITTSPTKPNVKLDNGLYAELTSKTVRPEWLGDLNIYNVIENHIKPLSDNSGYTVLLNKKEYTCIGYGFGGGTRKMNTLKDLSIIGSGMGEISLPNKEKIKGGTIIHGTVANSADGFKIKDLGIDLGAEWVDANNYIGWIGDKGDEGLILNEALDRTNLPKLITGCKAENIIINMYDINSRYHAFLNEASTGNYVNNIETHGGLHGFVIKSSDIDCRNIKVYGGSANAVIIKNDVRNISDIRIENMKVNPYKTKGDSNGINIQPNETWDILGISFSNVTVSECNQGFLGNAHEGVVANVSMNNVVISNCVNPTDLSSVKGANLWNITNVRVVNSGSFYLPISAKKVVRNIAFEQIYDAPSQKGDALFMIYNNTFLDGLSATGSVGYSYVGKIDSNSTLFSLDNLMFNGKLDANYNKFFVETTNLYTIDNKFYNFSLSPDYVHKDDNTYLYQTYGRGVVTLSFCLKRVANTSGSVIFTKTDGSVITIPRNQRFVVGKFSDFSAVPIVLGTDGIISTERITPTEVGDYIYGQIEINTSEPQQPINLLDF